MEVIRNLQDFPELAHAVVTSGTFDGVHQGHQKIINRLVQLASQSGGQSVVITYWPHPRQVLNPGDASLKLLSTIEERIFQLSTYPIDYLLIIPFTSDFANLTSEEYIQQVLVQTIKSKVLVIGYDHRFGKNREGSFDYLSKNAHRYGFQVEEIPEHDIEHVAVSSTKIRAALGSGKIATANKYLGRPYSLTGQVVHGKKLGRTIGYPTANILVPEAYKLIPAQGIYAVQVQVNNNLYCGMLSIGTNPTVGGTTETVEVNIFDFNEEIYDQFITIHFIQYLRPEEKYNSLEALKAQLLIDKQNSLLALSNH
ncbi:bifunctional riboflavin kinase/FAD synthetase [Adhaeribacter aquaticus]|uniref:bifunctional riboflavin kinase/FAD synthetase n=1 Tax=Adhaeribacter aquaticus TaxID=299567 RepID=UPI00040E58EE|nr:bifunctional riboflavin kinase/FAD synthetase [Adhaeribacter aquaticus]